MNDLDKFLQEVGAQPADQSTGQPTNELDAFLREVGAQEVKSPDRYTAMESGIEGARQGATLGFADELTAALGAGADWLFHDEPFLKGYESLRDAYRQESQQKQQEHPGAYMTGQVVGALPSAIATGGLMGTTAKGAAMIGGAEGGLAGAGYSEAENVGDLATDIAKGAGTGAALGAVGQKAIDAVSGLARAPGKTKELTAEVLTHKQMTDSLYDELARKAKAAGGDTSKYGLGPEKGGWKEYLKTGVEGVVQDVTRGEAKGMPLLTGLATGSLPAYAATRAVQAISKKHGKEIIRWTLGEINDWAKKLEIPKESIQKFQKTLKDAYNRSPQSMIAADYILQEQNADYRRLKRETAGSETEE